MDSPVATLTPPLYTGSEGPSKGPGAWEPRAHPTAKGGIPSLAMVSEGDSAPDFEGETADGRRLALADLLARGPVVLFFYVKDFTPG